MNNYVVFHLHSDLSLLDSCTNYKDYIDKAKELGQKAIAFTEHGNIYDWVAKKLYCEENGIKYLHGVECYLTEKLYTGEDAKQVRDNYHTILIARNQMGVKEINQLVDLSSQPSHFYYSPRITFDEFKQISHNVIKISACLASPLNALRDESLIRYYDYLEVQPHVNSADQKCYNLWLYEMSKKYHKPLIAGTDTHSLNSYKAECRSILKLAKKIAYDGEDEFDLTYKSYDELVEMFRKQGSLPERVYLEAIENTNRMADSVEDFKLDTSFKYPVLYDNEKEVFWNRIHTMYQDKINRGIIKGGQDYIDRINEEMRVFEKIGMIGFMLFMSELTEWCWQNDIPIGPCRGSVGGSLVAYITDIIDVNPMVWHTVFSRFANENRTEIGDVDIDLPPELRQEVYDHIIQRFGNDKTAYILAISTISDKGTIDEICRALRLRWEKEHQGEAGAPYEKEAVDTIKAAYDSDQDAARKKYPAVFYYFDGLLNTAISQSIHPAGIVVSPITLPDNYGTFWRDGQRVICINMEEIHEVSLVKYDLLALKNIGILRDCCELAGIPYPKSHEITWNDYAVWQDMITSPVGIFQFEGAYAFQMLQKFKPTQINDMNLVTAAIRPSGASFRDKLLAREVNKNPSPEIDELLKNNFGFCLFQEDTIAFLQQICGLSGSDSDNIRRAIGRKQRDRLEAAMPAILEGYCNHSSRPREVAEQEAKTFLQILEDSASYQFGYNHSTGYSMIGYMCAYMRYYHPVEFIAAYLNNAINEDDIAAGTQLANQKKIQIRSARYGHSSAKYVADNTAHIIYKGVGSIKYLNDIVANDLYSFAKEHPQIHSFMELLIALKESNISIDSRQMEILIRLDYFSDFGNAKELLRIRDWFNFFKQGAASTISSEKAKDILSIISDYISTVSDKTNKPLKNYKINDIKGLLYAAEQYVKTQNIRDFTIQEKIADHDEYLGYVDIATGLDSDRCKLIISKIYPLKTKQGTIWAYAVIARSLGSGKTNRLTVRASLYNRKPFIQNDIIQTDFAYISRDNKGYYNLNLYDIITEKEC